VFPNVVSELAPVAPELAAVAIALCTIFPQFTLVSVNLFTVLTDLF
jgi:hypothetical protein